LEHLEIIRIQFGIEAKVPGKSDQEIRDATNALNKNATINGDGSYTYDITLSSTIRSNGISALYFFLDPTTSVSGTRSMTILDAGFRKPGEPAYNPSVSQTYVTIEKSHDPPQLM